MRENLSERFFPELHEFICGAPESVKKAQIEKLYFDLEILENGPDKDDYERRFFEYTLDLGKLFVSPYNHDTFDFGDPEFVEAFRGFSKEAVKFREPKGSRHFIYVTRAHIGLYQMLMKMNAHIDIRPGKKILNEFLMKWDIIEQPV